LDNECIVFSVAKHGEEGRVAPRGEADEASEASAALDVGDNIGKVKGVRELRRED
ncbi:hypothetical protein MUK42_33635, partial [Musa troglodytarum]